MTTDDAKMDTKLTRESQQLLKVLPKEMWLLISSWLTDPNDIVKFCNISPVFRHLLKDQLVLLLFPKIWGIVKNKYLNELAKSDGTEEIDRFQRRSRLPSPKTISPWDTEFLKLRLVCQDWKRVLDNLYEDLADLSKFRRKTMFKLQCDWSQYEFIETQENVTSPFTQHFNPSHEKCKANPFLGRRFSLIYNVGGREYFNGICDILQKYGHHIWHAIVVVPNIFADRIQWYSKVREVLQLMPNLKSLDLEYEHLENNPARDNLDSQEMAQLIQEITVNPLPTFSNLFYIEATNLVTPIFMELIRKNNHVKLLEIRHWKKRKVYEDMYEIHLPNLIKTEIKVHNRIQFEKLENSVMRSPLQRIDLHFDGTEFIEWSRIFALLETKWSDTLTNLELKLPEKKSTAATDSIIMTDSLSYQLNLGKLRRLKVTLPNLSSIDFLLPMKRKLEFLGITISASSAVGKSQKQDMLVLKYQQKIQFVGWTTHLLDSNIWTLFPFLKSVNILESKEDKGSRFLYRREDWKEEMKMGKIWGKACACGKNTVHKCQK